MVQKITFVILILSNSKEAECTVNAVRELIQFNVAGHPVLHKVTNWPFDPEIGIRRSRQYQEINGRLGEKAIELLGLGTDGLYKERLYQQRLRDAGQLNGVNYLTP